MLIKSFLRSRLIKVVDKSFIYHGSNSDHSGSGIDDAVIYGIYHDVTVFWVFKSSIIYYFLLT